MSNGRPISLLPNADGQNQVCLMQQGNSPAHKPRVLRSLTQRWLSWAGLPLQSHGRTNQGRAMGHRESVKANRDVFSIEQAVVNYARKFPQLGQARVSSELKQMGYPVSASGVRYIWQKHDLETTYKRLKAVARKADGSVAKLTANQQAILKRGDASRKIARQARRAPDHGDSASIGDRREQIVLAAAQLFVERGYRGTSIRNIADSVGMLPGSVYHYYPAKEDLFVAIHHEGFRQLMDNIHEAIQRGADPWERLALACAEHIQDMATGNPISQVTATGMFAIYEDLLQRRLKKNREAYDQLFRRLIADLDLPDGTDRSLFRLALLGALNWTHVWYRPGKKTPREIAAQLVTMLNPSGSSR
ncbi:MAG: TetR/AcrR family transcriptional regulator [Proteobacteria bacterium]|nr:TetR/AcrR family transcriptional regulator [Pseudomonadota bacterium]